MEPRCTWLAAAVRPIGGDGWRSNAFRGYDLHTDRAVVRIACMGAEEPIEMHVFDLSGDRCGPLRYSVRFDYVTPALVTAAALRAAVASAEGFGADQDRNRNQGAKP